MNANIFKDIPQDYRSMIDQIQPEKLKEVYSKFDYLYLALEEMNGDQNGTVEHCTKDKTDCILYDYLKNYKFITYNYYTKESQDSSNQLTNAAICIENKCIIIERINTSLIEDLMENLAKKEGSKIIFYDLSIKYKDSESKERNSDILNAIDEVNQFYQYFRKNNHNLVSNTFLVSTYPSIFGYLRRRYFYPTSYFNDPTFFNFGNVNNLDEYEIKNQLKSFLLMNCLEQIMTSNQSIKEILNNIQQIKTSNSSKQDFQSKDLVILRDIKTNFVARFSLVIHIPSLHIFMMKRMFNNHLEKKEYECEFCKSYSHRCISPFYGFVKEKNQTVGFIYEYMSNGPLSNFKIKNDIFSLMTINRISQGIQFMHSNSLLYRDLKPSNILLNHDFIPYLSDFETVCKPHHSMTYDIGIDEFSSPEIKTGKEYSYPTDIYSFGKIIDFLFPNLQSESSQNLFNLFVKCTEEEPEHRPSNNDIKNVIVKEMKSVKYIEQFVLDETNNITASQAIQFILEYTFIQYDQINQIPNNIYKLFNFAFTIKQGIKSVYYFSIANIYEQGFPFGQDISKTIKYYEKSAEYMNAEALNNLGNLYKNGKYVPKNEKKAVEYYERAAELGSTYAIYNLGLIYEFGEGLQQNYSKAFECYSKLIRYNNPSALFKIGLFYENGYCVKQDYLRAKYYFEMASSLNDITATIHLGSLYENGWGVVQNYKIAIEYFAKAALKNDPSALFKVGLFFEKGYGVEKDYKRAMNFYAKSTKFGHSIAFVFLGNLYEKGLGTEKNYTIAKEYYEQAAKYNEPVAFLKLGELYENCFNDPNHYNEALKYYIIAANQNNPQAFLKIGLLYFNGCGVPQNYKNAKKWLKLAIERNSSDAMVILGILYLNGDGVKKNIVKAKFYLELGVKANNPEAYFLLGLLYTKYFGGYCDYKKAIELYTIAAQYNVSDAFAELGYIYDHGLGVERDFNKSKKYYEFGAKQDNSSALNNLGNIYLNGINVPLEYSRAKYYFELSSNLNNPMAIFNLGLMYFNGYGVEKNIQKAIEYFELSGSLNNSEALYFLGNIFVFGKGVEKDYSKAKKYYELSANFDNPRAYLNLGTMYFHGYGVEKDYQKAIKYINLAAQLNNPDSLYYMGGFYSSGDVYELNISKAISYFLKCIHAKERNKEIKYNCNSSNNLFNDTVFVYRAHNDLGLIYLAMDDIEKALEHIKEAGFNEFPYGQNNLGLMFQLYLNKIGNAERMFNRASENKFALAEFNLGYLKEKNDQNDEAISYYILASDHANEPFLYRETDYYDHRLEISKIFILALSDLKIILHYLLNSNNNESKKYFIRLLSNLQSNKEIESYPFQFRSDTNDLNDLFQYLKSYILDYPLFNLGKQPETQLNQVKPEQRIEINNVIKDDELKIYKEMKEVHPQNYKEESLNDFEFTDPSHLFSLIVKNVKLLEKFKKLIKEIIWEMELILFKPPYSILFGRIQITQIKKAKIQPNINDIFYEGFGLERF